MKDESLTAPDLTPLLSYLARLVAQELRGKLAPDEVLTTQEAAALLKLHPDTVGDLARRGELPAVKLGRDWRFTRSALLEAVSRRA